MYKDEPATPPFCIIVVHFETYSASPVGTWALPIRIIVIIPDTPGSLTEHKSFDFDESSLGFFSQPC